MASQECQGGHREFAFVEFDGRCAFVGNGCYF